MTEFEKKSVLEVLEKAGEIMLSAHGIESENGVTVKPGNANFVTVYDVKIQDYIISEIKKVFTDAVFIAEEKDNDAAVLQSEHCFVIDPIDGTTNFIRDYRHSCISLATVSRGEVVFGAVYDPYQSEMFTAEKGKGAFLNGMAMTASEKEMDMAITAYGTSPYYKDTLADKTFGICKELFMLGADVRRCGSAALDLAYTAAGRNDVFFECKLSPWDYAAGMLMITEAGGVISDMRGEPLSLEAPSSVIAANKKCYGQLLEITEKYV